MLLPKTAPARGAGALAPRNGGIFQYGSREQSDPPFQNNHTTRVGTPQRFPERNSGPTLRSPIARATPCANVRGCSSVFQYRVGTVAVSEYRATQAVPPAVSQFSGSLGPASSSSFHHPARKRSSCPAMQISGHSLAPSFLCQNTAPSFRPPPALLPLSVSSALHPPPFFAPLCVFLRPHASPFRPHTSPFRPHVSHFPLHSSHLPFASLRSPPYSPPPRFPP